MNSCDASEDDFDKNNKLIPVSRIVGSDKCGAQCPALSARNLISEAKSVGGSGRLCSIICYSVWVGVVLMV